jgi:5-methylcytosine-specific restriction endonuclease McrA
MKCIECRTTVQPRVKRCLPCHRIYKARKNCKTDGCASLSIAKGLCPKHYSAWRMITGARIKYKYNCLICNQPGTAFNKTVSRHAYCQRISTVNKDIRLSSSTELAVMPKPTPKPAPAVKGGFWWSGNCFICQKPFVSEFGHNTCSDNCLSLKNKDRMRRRSQSRRAREKKAFVERVSPKKVFDSNGWICQICFEPVDPDSQDVNTRATLDHVIPLAKGGKHSYENTQLAHGLCNSTKRDLLDYRMV